MDARFDGCVWTLFRLYPYIFIRTSLFRAEADLKRFLLLLPPPSHFFAPKFCSFLETAKMRSGDEINLNVLVIFHARFQLVLSIFGIVSL